MRDIYGKKWRQIRSEMKERTKERGEKESTRENKSVKAETERRKI